MTKEQRAESRAICEAAEPGIWKASSSCEGEVVYAVRNWMHTPLAAVEHESDAAFIAHARTALPAALDSLDEAERQYADAAIAGMDVEHELYVVTAGRDRWKARAEALERAIYYCVFEIIGSSEILCATCAYNGKGDDLLCEKCIDKAGKLWQFDQARFAPDAGKDGENP